MIRCRPRGICSWNFLLDGAGHHAALEFNWTGEQGAITADGMSLAVRKHGVFSGAWTLDHAGNQVAAAQKSNAFTRTFEIEDARGSLLLRAEAAFGRTFRLERSGELIATVAPDHAFTRRATIEVLAGDCDFTTLAFAFWLVVITWRRAANNNSGGA